MGPLALYHTSISPRVKLLRPRSSIKLLPGTQGCKWRRLEAWNDIGWASICTVCLRLSQSPRQRCWGSQSSSLRRCPRRVCPCTEQAREFPDVGVLPILLSFPALRSWFQHRMSHHVPWTSRRCPGAVGSRVGQCLPLAPTVTATLWALA